MSDHIIRASDNNAPFLDGDGNPISELELDRVDAAIDRATSVAELAAGQRSWRFGHVIVDEAQDLTPMQWRMLARRTRGDSMTVVGDLAQRTIGEPGHWADHLPPSIKKVTYKELTINYRAPAEVNDLATKVLDQLAPELTAPQSIRSVGHHPKAVPVQSMSTELAPVIAKAKASLESGTLVVIGLDLPTDIEHLTPWQAKGLEFDSVIIVEPARILEEEYGLSLLYVAITRSTSHLTIVHERPLPPVLADSLSR